MDWYNEHSDGLGEQFYHAVELTFNRIIENPQVFSEYEKKYKKAMVPVFPYNVIFKVRGKSISVHSVLYHSRSNKKILKRRFKK